MTQKRADEIVRKVIYARLNVMPELKDSKEAFDVGRMIGQMQRQLENELFLEVNKNEEYERCIENLKKLKSFHNGSYGADIDMAIKAMKAESILGKIKADIEQAYCKVENDYDKGRNSGLYIATQIIDNYKAESEG